MGAGVLDSENKGRIRWQPSLIGRLSRARPSEGSEECAWELYLVSNQSSGAPSTHTVGRSSCKISKPKKVRQRKRAMVRFRGVREKGTMGFVECLGVPQEDTMEAPLWREALGRNLGSHGAAELVGGVCHGNGCRQETTRLHAISCTKTGWSSLIHNPVLHQALTRSLRESKVQFVVEDTWPFGEGASGQNGRLNPLRMDITTEAGVLFDNHPRLKNKALLLDITIVNPCAGSNLGNAARHVGKHLADAVERKKTSIGARSPLPTLCFLSLCRLVVRLARTCMPSSRSSPSDG